MQQPSTPKAPSAPSAPVSSTPVVVGLPTTGQEVAAARIRLKDLQNQLQDAAARRQNISSQLLRADPSARAGIEARMNELDARILRIERDISATTGQITNAPTGALTAGTRDPFDMALNRLGDNIVPIVVIPTIFLFFPFAIAMSRLIWRRTSATPRQSAVADPAVQNRLEQLQQSVDTIAIEIERISEGQRFVTKVLSERPALGAGAADPIRTPKKAAVPSERG